MYELGLFLRNVSWVAWHPLSLIPTTCVGIVIMQMVAMSLVSGNVNPVNMACWSVFWWCVCWIWRVGIVVGGENVSLRTCGWWELSIPQVGLEQCAQPNILYSIFKL